MRITEFSIALATPPPRINDAAISFALSGALNDWRRDGASPTLSARAILADSCARIADAALERRMRIHTEVDPALELPAHQGVRFKLIADSLLANAVAHAHPSGVIGEIALRCTRDDTGHILLEVADDGVGLPEPFNIAQHGGTGLALVSVLAHQLGANVQLKTGACGLLVEVRAPSDAVITGK